MNKGQKNHVDMLNTVLMHLESSIPVWENNTLIKEEYSSLKNIVTTIHTEEFKQVQKDPRGFTKLKNAQFDLVVQLTVHLLSKIRPFARKTNNTLLLQSVNVNRSEFIRTRSTTAISKCQIIVDKGHEHLEHLVIYKVTRENLDELQGAIDKYKPMTAQRNTIGDSRTTATANISTLLNEAKLHLQNLDDLIPTQLSEQDFITTYFQTKKIGIARGRKAKPAEPITTNIKENK